MKRLLVGLSLIIVIGVIGFSRQHGQAEEIPEIFEPSNSISENESILEDGSDDTDIRSAVERKKYTQEEYEELLEAIPEGYELVEGQITIE